MSEAKIRRALSQRQKREAPLEQRCIDYAKKRGLVSRKMNGLGFRAWPDRLFLPPNMAAPWASHSKLLWVEFKKPGLAPTPAQARLHDDLLCRGQPVVVIDDYQRFKATVDAYLDD